MITYHNSHRKDLVIDEGGELDSKIIENALGSVDAYVAERFGESLFGFGAAGGSQSNLQIGKQQLKNWQAKSVQLYDTDVFFRNCINNIMSLTLGKGARVIFESDSDQKNWNLFKRRNGFETKMQQAWRTSLIMGESFIRIFKPPSRIKRVGAVSDIRLISPLRISSIVSDDKDFETITSYNISTKNSSDKDISVKAEEIIHIKHDPYGTRQRGTPLVSLGAIKKLERYDLLEYTRLLLNVIRASIPLVRKIPGTPDQVTKAANSFKKMPAPGSVLTVSMAEEIMFPQLNINALDTAEDSDKLLRGVAADVGLTVDFISGVVTLRQRERLLDPSSPITKSMEAMQTLLSFHIDSIVLAIMGDVKYEVKLPRVAMRSLQSDAQGLSAFWKAGAISEVEMADYLGVDYYNDVRPNIKRLERDAKTPPTAVPDNKTIK